MAYTKAQSEAISQMQRVGRSYDSYAQNDAVKAVREPTPENRLEAAKSVAAADAAKQCAEQCIRIVQALWPAGEVGK